MKSSKIYNNISDKLKAQIPKLKPGQVVTFYMLNGTPNPEPDPRERAKQGEVLYGKVQILTNFRIYDPYQQDGEGNEVGGYVDVGCVDQWDGEKPLKFRLFVPGIKGGSLFQGKFDLVGGKIQDEELFEVLWLSPQREGSPCADASVEVLFKILDVKAEAKATINKYDRLKKALDILSEISEEDARRVMMAVNQPVYQDNITLMAKLKEWALSNVDAFLNTYDNPKSHMKAEIKKAMDAGVLKYEFNTGDVKVGGATVTTMKMKDITGFVDALVMWINSAENGNDVLNNIRHQVAAKKKAGQMATSTNE
jgi:hypothetical protein